MALYDNKYWLLSHIRNSFIHTDDTGVCETVMAPESKLAKEKILSQEPYPDPYSDSDLSDDEEIGSFDLQMDMDFGLRERSMTAARLEKLEYHSRKAAKMKHIKWEMKKKPETESSQKPVNDENEELFVKKDCKGKSEPLKSGLTSLMTQFTNLPLNPYMEYARYDGTGQINIPTRKYRIYLTMLPADQRNYPLDVCCVATAKIQDLIGLILLKFSTTHADVILHPVSHYGLYITEEDGELDDFPALDCKECVAKFGFTSLGLVEHKELPRNVSFDNTETIPSSPDHERKRPPSTSRAEETKLNKDNLIMERHHKEVEAPLYKSYKVYIVHKVRQKTEVHLGISGEKFEIDPITQKNSKFTLVKQKPVSHHFDSIAWCESGDLKGSKMTFKVTYISVSQFGEGSSYNGEHRHSFPLNSSFPPTLHSSPSFKHYEFEADFRMAAEIVEKIKLILELRSSQVKSDYMASKEKKSISRRKTFNLKS